MSSPYRRSLTLCLSQAMAFTIKVDDATERAFIKHTNYERLLVQQRRGVQNPDIGDAMDVPIFPPFWAFVGTTNQDLDRTPRKTIELVPLLSWFHTWHR